MSHYIQLKGDLYLHDTKDTWELLASLRVMLAGLPCHSSLSCKKDDEGMEASFIAYGCVDTDLSAFRKMLRGFAEYTIIGTRIECFLDGDDITFYIGNEEQQATARHDYARAVIITLAQDLLPDEKHIVLEDFQAELDRQADPAEVEEGFSD